jgi:hypothetical protein
VVAVSGTIKLFCHISPFEIPTWRRNEHARRQLYFSTESSYQSEKEKDNGKMVLGLGFDSMQTLLGSGLFWMLQED